MSNLDFGFNNPNFPYEWRTGVMPLLHMASPSVIPAGVVERIEEGGTVLERYRAGKEMACADVVIVTRTPKGAWAALLSKRKAAEPFGGKWWIYGGSVGAYQDLITFVANRAQKECGIPVRPEALIGFYRTCAADRPQSTTQLCFVARVAHEVIQKKMATDPNHEEVRLFTLDALAGMEAPERHWYPVHVATLALEHAFE